MTRFAAVLIAFAAVVPLRADEDKGWEKLFDGKSLDGWKANEKPECFTVKDGCLVCKGGMAHLFYMGPDGKASFKNFELKVEVKTETESNSGIFFHTELRPGGGLVKKGYEAQINATYEKDKRKTGSLVIVKDVFEATHKDNEWFEYHIVVKGKRIELKVNGKTIVDYTEEEKPVRPKGREERLLSSGTFAIQAHDPKSVTWFKNLRVKRLPD